ncbi:MAG: phage portal protein [Rhizobiales bacterium]|nr:phage portal protein [Hyphomicrobiales bacterium]
MILNLFSLFKRQPETKSGIASPEDWLFEAFGAQPSAAGISVNPSNAIRCAPVRAAVGAVAETLGVMPLHTLHRVGEGKERATNHPTYALLHDTANPWTPAAQFREQVTADAMLYHGGFAQIVRNAEGKPLELWRLNPATVTVDYSSGEPAYEVQENGTKRKVARENILHIPSPSLSGRGLVADGCDVIGLALTLERYASKLFANGARPSGVLSLKGNTTPDALAKAKASWIAAHGGDKAGGTAVIPSDAEWSALTMTSVDSQFLELRKFAIEEISRLFRVPPHILYELGRATWSNSEQMRQDFLDFSLMRWITAWEGEIRLKLFKEDERATYHAEFLTDAFVRADIVKRTEAYTKATGGPWLTPNEVRAAENRSPIDGGDTLRPPANAIGVVAQ